MHKSASTCDSTDYVEMQSVSQTSIHLRCLGRVIISVCSCYHCTLLRCVFPVLQWVIFLTPTTTYKCPAIVYVCTCVDDKATEGHSVGTGYRYSFSVLSTILYTTRNAETNSKRRLKCSVKILLGSLVRKRTHIHSLG